MALAAFVIACVALLAVVVRELRAWGVGRVRRDGDRVFVERINVAVQKGIEDAVTQAGGSISLQLDPEATAEQVVGSFPETPARRSQTAEAPPSSGPAKDASQSSPHSRSRRGRGGA